MDPRGPNGALAAALVVLDALAGAASRIVKIDRPDAVSAPTTSAYNPMAADADDEAAVELAEFFSEYGDGGDASPTPLVSYGSPAARARSGCGSTTTPRRVFCELGARICELNSSVYRPLARSGVLASVLQARLNTISFCMRPRLR